MGIVGDRVQPLNGKLDADEGPNAWRLSPGEVATVAEVEENGEVKLRNPAGDVSELKHRKFYGYVQGSSKQMVLTRNDSKALRFWHMAVERGAHRNHMNILQFILDGRDSRYPTARERCLQALKHARELVMNEHPLIIMLHSLAHRAYENDDLAGALLF